MSLAELERLAVETGGVITIGRLQATLRLSSKDEVAAPLAKDQVASSQDGSA
ncbi:hypothetical protein [Nocardioides caldifontis]|uniref:hypothetical protein n=1 Tax=Nocardioides caldifontis TaxID=2588938 RepID=UPI001396797E|nr:hypothetical protein [Nocardioides caldifontis]